jgi:putative ABC transport system substrate-binding protein
LAEEKQAWRAAVKRRGVGLSLVIVFSVVAGSIASHAQQPGKAYRMGYLAISPGNYERDTHNCPITGSPNWQEFLEGLRERGYVPGKNLSIECRWTEDQDDQAPPLAAELVSLKPDIMVALGTWQVRAAKQATSTIPIVMIGVIDPVGRGLVDSLAHPGKNVTGLTDTLLEMEGKRLQFLKEAVPNLSRVAVLHRKGRMLEYWTEHIEAAARKLGLKLHGYSASGPEELLGAFAAMVKAEEEALYVVPTGIWEMGDTPQRLVEFATQNRLPSTFQSREFVQLGGLMSYCVDTPAIRRRIGFYVDKILNGANPGDLPVEQPTKFNLVINLKTAGSLGLTIPPTLLMLAEEVIN